MSKEELEQEVTDSFTALQEAINDLNESIRWLEKMRTKYIEDLDRLLKFKKENGEI